VVRTEQTYSAAVRITQPSEIAMYAKVFEHYSRRAAYGQRAAGLISLAIADLAQDLSQATSGNIVDPRSPFSYPEPIVHWKSTP
jgi:hypothetical protein